LTLGGYVTSAVLNLSTVVLQIMFVVLRRFFCSFQVTDLKRIFQFCVQALGELSKLVPPYSDEVLALLKHLLSIAEGVLSWGFISAYHILYGLLYPCYLLLKC